MSNLPAASPLLEALFTMFALVVAAALPAAVRWSGLRDGVEPARLRRQTLVASLLTASWLGLTAGAAALGWLHFTPPPTMMLVLGATFVLAIGLVMSPLGRRIASRLPIAALVVFHVFRVGVELLMHRAYVEGLMPRQMSYSGRNFDILTGLTAATVALWLFAGGRSWRIVFAWNVLGTLLLANILGVALLSAPTPFRVFMNEPANIWITQAPWVWLPTVFVLLAIAGHGVLYRRLWQEIGPASPKPRPMAVS